MGNMKILAVSKQWLIRMVSFFVSYPHMIKRNWKVVDYKSMKKLHLKKISQHI